MSDKPVIFISYSHKDEPASPTGGEVAWLSFVRTYLQPAIKHGIFDLFVDEHLHGGDALDPEIESKLRACDIFILLISANSTASSYIVDTEIRITRERQANGEDVHFYPLLLTPTPKIALDKLKDMVIRPRDAQPLSSFLYDERLVQMNAIADEIADIAAGIVSRKPVPLPRASQPAYVHITGLPETAYERLVGRETELKQLDDSWVDNRTKVLSLIAEGGAGKSALTNEWLKRIQADNYRGAEAVLGWSFYSQGSKERATAADGFLSWALVKLGIKLDTTSAPSASAKGEAIAEAMMRRRVILVLDGAEPLQHGPGPQVGQLKDLGLRALLRRFAAMPPAATRGLIVVTSRVVIKDIAPWKDAAAPVVNVEELSEEAGAALLRDNGVWGTDRELKATSHDFGGHPLALALLASFLAETQFGDVRRRDHIRQLLSDTDNRGHEHAKRVMESYEKEWLASQPILLAMMHMVGLFDRPARVDCLAVLRENPVINGFPSFITDVGDEDWNRAIMRLREVRLLAPADHSVPAVVDAHPLVRDWFGERFRQSSKGGWRVAQGRIYEHLRDVTREGKMPTLEDLAPLYQAIAHGCRAGRHEEALNEIYRDRISRRESGPNRNLEYYAMSKLGAVGSELAAISGFFDKPYQSPVSTLKNTEQIAVLGIAAFCLRAQGRFTEALSAQHSLINRLQSEFDWKHGVTAKLQVQDLPQRVMDLSKFELLAGQVTEANASALRSVELADRGKSKLWKIASRVTLAYAVQASGRQEAAERLFAHADQQFRTSGLNYKTGHMYSELVLAKTDWPAVLNQANEALNLARKNSRLVNIGLHTLALGRANFGFLLQNLGGLGSSAKSTNARAARAGLDDAVDRLRSAGNASYVPLCLLARAVFRRSVGDWLGASRDLDEVEEIAEPGPMRLYLCDMALERARLAFAQIEAVAPLNVMLEEDNPPKPELPSADEIAKLKAEAEKQIKIADGYIQSCGYHRRDEELAELYQVLRGEKNEKGEVITFASLPPRV